MATITATTPNQNGRSPLVKALRVTLTLFVVAAACSVSFGFGRLWRQWRSIARPSESPRALADFEPLLAVPSLAGRWSFADLEWTLQSQDVGLNEVEIRFSAAASSTSAVAGSPEMNKTFDHFVQTLHMEPVQRGDNRVYTLDKPDLKAQLVLRDRAGHTDLIALHVATQKSADRWQLFELAPRDKLTPVAESSHLLPLPAAARRSAGRFDNDGRLLLEFAGLQSNADALVALWKQHGWEVRPSEFAERGGLNFSCVRGEEFIYVWSADPPTAIQNLMLVRSPIDTQQPEAKPIN